MVTGLSFGATELRNSGVQLDAILPFHTIWQFFGGELQMYYATIARNCCWSGIMKQEWSHEDRITPAGDTRHGSALRPILNLSIRQETVPV